MPNWYYDAKSGIFILWGMYSVPAYAPHGELTAEKLIKGELGFAESPYAEWYQNSLRLKDSPTQQYHAKTYGADFRYEQFAPMFNEQLGKWNPDSWADLFANAGARYVVLVTKHHDGFLMWNSQHPNPRNTNWQASRDVAGELNQAVNARGMKRGFYYSSLLGIGVSPKRPSTRSLNSLHPAIPAAEVSGWKNRQKNEGYGVAITECFASTVGQIVKVSRHADGKVKIDRVWAVIDCGWYVNPDTIKAQVEGSIVMALGAATIHEITFKDGMTGQRNFYDYKMPRINDIPPIEVFIMENDAHAGGVGEPGLPPFAPALTNAVYDLTGKRIRTLPFRMEEV